MTVTPFPAGGRAGAGPEPETFDICGELPAAAATTLLEASAGTGKTWTIAALVTRLVAEGRGGWRRCSSSPSDAPPARSCASASVPSSWTPSAHLDGAPAWSLTADPDTLTAMLADCDAESARPRLDRLREALTDFDAATIATTHQFCQLVLRSLGVAGDTDARARAGREPRRAADRGGRRPLRRRFRPLRGRPGTSTASDPRRSPARRSTTRRPAWSSRTRRRRRAEPARSVPPVALRLRRARRAGPAQAPPRRAQLRRPAQPPRARAEDEHAPARRADARAVALRAGRRVPGHRPGAVAGPRPGFLRPRHDGADRRPEAGDLRLPRRRRDDLPPGRRATAGDQAHPRHELPQRRAARSTRSRRVLRGAALGTRASSCATWTPAHRAPPRGAPHGSRSGCGCVDRSRFGGPRARGVGIGALRDVVADDLAADVARAAGRGGLLRRSAARGPATSRCCAAKRAQCALVRDALLAARGAGGHRRRSGSVYATEGADEWLCLLEAVEKPHRQRPGARRGADVVLRAHRRRARQPTATR